MVCNYTSLKFFVWPYILFIFQVTVYAAHEQCSGIISCVTRGEGRFISSITSLYTICGGGSRYVTVSLSIFNCINFSKFFFQEIFTRIAKLYICIVLINIKKNLCKIFSLWTYPLLLNRLVSCYFKMLQYNYIELKSFTTKKKHNMTNSLIPSCFLL